MEALREVVHQWVQLGDNEINQEFPTCCHGAWAVRRLRTLGEIDPEVAELVDYRRFPQELVKALGYGNDAQVILMLREAGAPDDPFSSYPWENREQIYANLLKVERLPSLVGADLSCADLRNRDLSGTDMSDIDLTGADLTYTNLAGAKLVRANLTNAMLIEASLDGADLSESDLSGAIFREASLRNAKVKNAKCVGTDFDWADFTYVDFTGSTWVDVSTLGIETDRIYSWAGRKADPIPLPSNSVEE